MWRRSSRTLFHHLAYLAEACRLVQWTDAARVEHLHAHFGTNPAEVAMLAHALGGPPYSFTVHGPEEFDSPGALGLGEKGRRAAFVVAISSFGRSQLLRWLPAADWPKVEVVHCGLEPAFHRGAPAAAAGGAAAGVRRPAVRAEGPAAAGRGGASASSLPAGRSSWCWPATARCAPRSRR